MCFHLLAATFRKLNSNQDTLDAFELILLDDLGVPAKMMEGLPGIITLGIVLPLHKVFHTFLISPFLLPFLLLPRRHSTS